MEKTSALKKMKTFNFIDLYNSKKEKLFLFTQQDNKTK